VRRGKLGELQTEALCDLHELHAVVRAELLPDRGLMIRNRLLAQPEPFRDHGQRKALHEQAQHFELARG